MASIRPIRATYPSAGSHHFGGDNGAGRAGLQGAPDPFSGFCRLLDALAAAGIEIDMLGQHREVEKYLDLSFVVHKSDYERSLPVLGEIGRELGVREVVEEPGLAKISVVGVGVRRAHARVAARICRTLAELGIAVRLIASS